MNRFQIQKRQTYGNIVLFIFLFLVSCQTPVNEKRSINSAQASHSEALEIARKDLPSEGRLEQGRDGYIYLKVSNDYVHRLFPLIKQSGFHIPSSIQRNTKTGAHISVFYKKEGEHVGKIPEIGKIYSFIPTEIKVVRSKSKEYVILEVSAPELENLRKKYHLSPKLMGHEFHITLAEKRS